MTVLTCSFALLEKTYDNNKKYISLVSDYDSE